MFQLLYVFIQAIQPFLVPVGIVFAWGLLLLILWSIWAAIADTFRQAQQMHQIPCANCVFFTHDYHLKCPVQPLIALSEQAINCSDFRKKSSF